MYEYKFRYSCLEVKTKSMEYNFPFLSPWIVNIWVKKRAEYLNVPSIFNMSRFLLRIKCLMYVKILRCFSLGHSQVKKAHLV